MAKLRKVCGKIILAISLILIVHLSYGQSNRGVFKLSDYVLVRTDSSSLGLERKIYVYRYDALRKMEEVFHYDGTILGRSFSYRGRLEGNLETFNEKGMPMAIDSFHNGVKVSSRSFNSTDSGAMFFSHGKLRPLKNRDVDSLLKKH